MDTTQLINIHLQTHLEALASTFESIVEWGGCVHYEHIFPFAILLNVI